ncbi:phosphopantothenate--cysteine ligase (ATP) [Malassezia obtusa]|uniref:Phosphopantothenate--cysteine ligase (ATP) n=1 Tax=Malassezia obtusa TaxID=76774 RepID=A0AAF0DXD7_9BASI|nr:phosphopantothenate--cysteine ligase (ATP) [Malassezia obtusa]
MAPDTAAWTPERFYAEYDPPAGYDGHLEQVRAFVNHNQKAGRKVVLVTSGGTTVPLERNVQFPYTRRYSHTTNPFFDILDEPASSSGTQEVRVESKHVGTLLPVLHAYHQARQSGCLLPIPFVTVIEYLFLLPVSDFFIPMDRMAEHKIQSSDGALHLTMEPVPKVLSSLVREWVPDAYVVSFKLETDDNLIIPKAEKSLERYGHQLVIGNDLARRKTEVVLVEHTARVNKEASAAAFTHTQVCIPKDSPGEIEEHIVKALRDRHEQWIKNFA